MTDPTTEYGFYTVKPVDVDPYSISLRKIVENLCVNCLTSAGAQCGHAKLGKPIPETIYSMPTWCNYTARHKSPHASGTYGDNWICPSICPLPGKKYSNAYIPAVGELIKYDCRPILETTDHCAFPTPAPRSAEKGSLGQKQ